MNNYFFSNESWGPCYTVMANNKEEAIAKVKKFLIDEIQKMKDCQEGKKKYVNREFKKVGNIKLKHKYDTHGFVIREFNDSEVIETEYA